MKRLIAVALALAAMTGCSAVRAATGGDREPGPLVVVLFDVSRSTDDADVRARYLTTFETVLDQVASTHGTVVGDVIDDDPLAHSTFPISAAFESCDPLTQNRLVCDAGSARTRATASRPRATSSRGSPAPPAPISMTACCWRSGCSTRTRRRALARSCCCRTWWSTRRG